MISGQKLHALHLAHHHIVKARCKGGGADVKVVDVRDILAFVVHESS